MTPVAFTPAQLRAAGVAERHLDACVVAGPGSGKTTVLVEYFRRLVEAGVDPLRILAITFTEKAAGHMREKLGEAYRDSPELRARLERAWVSTIDGFCMRLLRENAVAAGVDPAFTIADERASRLLQQESMAGALDALLREDPAGAQALIRGLSSSDLEDPLLSAYDAMRCAGITVDGLAHFPAPPGTGIDEIADTLRALGREEPRLWSSSQRQELDSALEGAERIVAAPGALEALREAGSFACSLTHCKKGNTTYRLLQRMKKLIEDVQYTLITELYARERELLADILRRFDHDYRERKRLGGVLDFADLCEATVRLLEEHPATRARVKAQFDHVLMDEFQDTNGQQARLLELVRPPGRFYAVGDINQSIYGFRHAEPEGFTLYRDSLDRGGGRVVELDDNFRSRPEILSAVETIFDGAEGIQSRALVARRRFDEPREVCVEVAAATDLETEARWVAARILELDGFAFKDIAVLVRNTEVISAFTAAFDQVGIPFVVNRGKGFYEAREVNDLTHLLRAIANPRDEISLAAVLRSPLVAVSDEALLRLKTTGDNLAASLARLEPGDSDDDRKLARFRDRLRDWRIRREYVAFDRLLLAAIDDCGYQPESGSRGAANIDKFLAQARDAATRLSLDAFVEELALVRASNPREPDAPPEDSANTVQVMTAHSAKGLEFPVVFVAALHKGIDTGLPTVAFSRKLGLGARWLNPADGGDKGDLFEYHIRKERQARENEESRRLLYVAMTRAEQHLALSFSGKPKEWAREVMVQLHLEGEGDGVLTRTAPDGKPWKLRFSVLGRGGPSAHGPARASAAHPEAPAHAVEILPPPRITEQHDANASVTALSAFAGCPRQYFLRHYLGFAGRPRKWDPDAADDGLSAAGFGIQVHALLAGDALANPDPEAARLAEVFRQSPLGRRAARAGRVEREFDFLMSVEDLVISGQVDLWFEEGGELVIVDYKTDSVTATEAHQRAQDYALQLRLYAMAVERLVGRPPDRAWLYFLRPNAAVEVDLAPSLLDSPEQVARDFQEAQDQLQFPLNEGERCRRCPFYRDLCPAMYNIHRETDSTLSG